VGNVDALEIKNYRRGKLIHIRLSPKTHQRLKIRVAELGTTMQRYVSRTVRRSLLPPKPKAPKPTKQPKIKPVKAGASKVVVNPPVEAPKKPEQTKGTDK
jgi:hypothetical protein